MNGLRLLAIALFMLLPALSQATDDNDDLASAMLSLTQTQGDGYGYPIPGTFSATILGTPQSLRIPPPDRINARRLVLDVIPERTVPSIFFYNEGLRVTVALQTKKAPLLFIIAGTGSSDQASRLLSMMGTFYQAGYHVVTLPSPTHANFIVSASRSQVPGDLTEDAADIYAAMEAVWSRLNGRIEVSEFFLSGYSLGGTQAAFVAKLDEERKSFNFEKVWLINPAVSLYDSVKRIEATLDNIPGGPKKIGVFFNDMLARFTEFYRESDALAIDDTFLFSVYQSHLLTPGEAGGLIGLAFRISSAGMIFASDVMTNGGYVVPKNKTLVMSDSLDDYFRVSVRLSFIDYLDEYLFPHFQKQTPGLTREQFIAAQSLRSIEPYLKSSSKFGATTNENDFILSDEDRSYLKALFGERTTIRPRGGHLGNMEFRDNMKAALAFLRPAGEKP